MISEILEKKGETLPESIIERLEKYAEENKITGKREEEMVSRSVENFRRYLVQPGEAVGTVAAQSIGEPGTQMMMRTKHYAGVAMQVTRGLPRLIEIFDARSSPSTPHMEVYLLPEIGTDEQKATEMARKLIDIRLEQVAKTIDIDLTASRVVVEFDKKKLKDHGIEVTDTIKLLKKEIRYRLELEGDRLMVYARKPSASALYHLRDKVRKAHFCGIANVEHAVLQQEGKEFVIHTRGSNLKEVMNLEFVDKSRTVTNDIHQVSKVLGIEAARSAIIREAMDTLREAGLTVDLRHIMLIADTICSESQVRAIGRHGVSGEKGSVLARASFEETVKHLLDASSTGETEALEGVIENIIVGQVMALGTGLPRLTMKGKE